MRLFHSGGASAVFSARFVDRALCSLAPSAWLSALPDFVCPTRAGTDHFHMVSRPWTTLYCFPRYSISKKLISKTRPHHIAFGRRVRLLLHTRIIDGPAH